MYAVRLDNVVDLGGYALKEAWNPTTVWAFKDPAAQIKSADPVTYDDSGNVIPLSERFDEKNDDIRYSTKKKAQKNTEYSAVRTSWRPVKQGGSNSTHVKMSSAAVAEILSIPNIANATDSVKSAISVLGTLYDAVDGRKLVMGFKKPITGSNLEGSLVAAGVLQRSGNGAIEVRNHIECTNFVLKTPMEPLTIKYIKDIHVKLQLRRERHNLGLVAWRFLFGINGIQFFDAFCLCLEGLIWNSDVLVSAQLRPVAI